MKKCRSSSNIIELITDMAIYRDLLLLVTKEITVQKIYLENLGKFQSFYSLLLKVEAFFIS